MSTTADTELVRPSSTVILARAGEGDPEIFMVRRHALSSFGSAFAFPGGVVDPEDSEVHEHCDGVADANQRLGTASGGLDYYSAAIRELFEEAGVLLADYSSLDEALASVRDELNDGSLNWADFVRGTELRLRCADLHYISHWITPELEPKRYSTRFFLAALPDEQVAVHCGGELTESRWATASEMLAAERRKEVTMIFPTIKTLESIARHKSLSDLLDWASSSVDWGITTMVPVAIELDGRMEILLPGDLNYPGTKS